MDGLIPSLRERVAVSLDTWGVPHVSAQSRDDLYRVQGFLHSQSRGWQMEMLARFGRGCAAEVVGEAAASFDTLARRLGFARAAEAAARRLVDDDLRILEPYAEGVLAADAVTPLSPEYQALGVERTWRTTLEEVLIDACAIAVIRAFALSGSSQRRIVRAWLEAVERASAPEEIARLRAAWTAFSPPSVEASDAGSNAFAVAGSRTASGAPLLGGDPHLKTEAPCAWMEMHLRCPGQHVSGASLPGLPNILLGRNERVAWAITSSQADVADCYLERVDRVAGKYLTPQGWVPLQRRTEVVTVRGGPDLTIEVEETRNGPIIAANFGTEGEAISWRWVHAEVASRQQALEGMNEAANWPQFRDALSIYSGVGLSIVYADVEGVIARQQVGPVPRRAAGRPEPRIRCGWTSEEYWQGLVPFDQLSSDVNPTSGIVCAANNNPGPGSEVSGEDWDWDGRARRMRELLRANDALSTDDCRSVQLDLRSPLAATLVSVLLVAEPDDKDEDARAALKEAAAWDLRLDVDSAAAAVFDRWYLALVRGLVPGGASSDLVNALTATRSWWSCWGVPLVTRRLDAMAADERVRRSTDALRAAVSQLREAFGPGPWTYGQLTETSYEHALGPALSIGPVRLPGGIDTLWRGDGSGRGNAVPTLRQISDLADLDGGLAALCTGNSGVPGDPHYADQMAMFLEGGYRSWPLSGDATSALTVEELNIG